MQVAEWMTTPVLTIKRQDTLRHARELMTKYRINQLPVVSDGVVIGIVTDRDIRDAYPSSLRLLDEQDINTFSDNHTIEAVMTFDVVTVPPHMSIREAARLLRKGRFGALPVVEHNTIKGVLTRSDILDAFLSET